MEELANVTRRTALAGGAAGLAATLLSACGSGAASGIATAAQSTAETVFGKDRAFRFTVVNDATLSAGSVPAQNGVYDACQLLGCSYEWTGSQTGEVDQMVSAIAAAVNAGVDGIATTLIDPTAFDAPVAAALGARIPVLAYGADAPRTGRLAYIGQDLERAGERMGARIRALLPEGGAATLFVAAPGAGNVAPRVRGITSALRSSAVRLEVVGSSLSESAATAAVQAYVAAHPSCRGFFGCDAGSTAAVGTAIQKYGLGGRGVVSGGFDLTPSSQQLLAAGYLDFVVDQQPYLQGFLAILELYLYNVSERLTGAADVDTGAHFLERATIAPYSSTKSRFEGTASGAGVQPA